MSHFTSHASNIFCIIEKISVIRHSFGIFDCILKDFALMRNVSLVSYLLFFHVFIDEICSLAKAF